MGGTKIKKHEQIEEPVLAETSVTTETDSSEPTLKKSNKKKKAIKKVGKKYTEIKKLIDPSKYYNLSDAIELTKKTVFTKFTPSVEVHINLNTDPKISSHNIRTTVNLPHSVGKSTTLIVFGSESDKDTIKAANALIGTEETLNELESGKINIDGKPVAIESSKLKLISTPEWMPKMAKVAKILGPKGLMPNPKSGTVTDNVAETLKNFQGGLVEVRTQEGQAVVHTIVGKTTLENDALRENTEYLIKSLEENKPSSFKKSLIRSVYLSTTMGPSIKVDLNSFK